MDGERFDRVAMAWAASPTRRAILARLAAGALGGVLARLGRAAPVAAGRKGLGEPCRHDRECKFQNCEDGKCRCLPRSISIDLSKECPAIDYCCASSERCCRRLHEGFCCGKNERCCRRGSKKDCCPKKKPICCRKDSPAACCPKDRPFCCETGFGDGGCCPPGKPVCCPAGHNPSCCPAGTFCGPSGCDPEPPVCPQGGGEPCPPDNPERCCQDGERCCLLGPEPVCCPFEHGCTEQGCVDPAAACFGDHDACAGAELSCGRLGAGCKCFFRRDGRRLCGTLVACGCADDAACGGSAVCTPCPRCAEAGGPTHGCVLPCAFPA